MQNRQKAQKEKKENVKLIIQTSINQYMHKLLSFSSLFIISDSRHRLIQIANDSLDCIASIFISLSLLTRQLLNLLCYIF